MASLLFKQTGKWKHTSQKKKIKLINMCMRQYLELDFKVHEINNQANFSFNIYSLNHQFHTNPENGGKIREP